MIVTFAVFVTFVLNRIILQFVRLNQYAINDYMDKIPISGISYFPINLNTKNRALGDYVVVSTCFIFMTFYTCNNELF